MGHADPPIRYHNHQIPQAQLEEMAFDVPPLYIRKGNGIYPGPRTRAQAISKQVPRAKGLWCHKMRIGSDHACGESALKFDRTKTEAKEP